MTSIYSHRRDEVLRRLAEGGGVAVIPTHPEFLRSGDTHFRFRAGNDLYYLTGLAEPGSVVVLTPFHPDHHYVLFVRPRDPEMETWTGRRTGVEGAVSRFGAQVAYPIQELAARLPEYLRHAEQVYYPRRLDPSLDGVVDTAINDSKRFRREGSITPHKVADPGPLLHELRLFKRPEELELMKKAAHITAMAHKEAMAATRPGLNEYHIEAVVEYTFRHNGAVGPAYPSIVGAGDNATILHYVENDAPLVDGQLLLIDAGCEYRCYNADVTRTFPVNGRFSPVQRDVYEVVLASQLAAIDLCRVGQRFVDPHLAAVKILAQGMIDLGLLQGSLEEVLDTQSYRRYYMHRTSHWLGMDVHDVGDYFEGSDRMARQSRSLMPGMVLTIEPGFYVPAHDTNAPQHLRGVGVRIEDDILVTGGNPDNLTWECPKKISELEALVGTRA